MSRLRRYYSPGNTYFITVVTFDRRPILLDNIDLLYDAFDFTCSRLPYNTLAYVILPEHFHLIVNPGENSLSDIIKIVKLRFSGKYRHCHRMKSGRLWQLRFWDHIIRNQKDLNQHIDYTHYNPVKHGQVAWPIDYCHSSFREYIMDGYYSLDWGEGSGIGFDGEYGE